MRYVFPVILFVTVCLMAGASGADGGDARVIPFSELGAEVQKQYSGDGISIRADGNGARLEAALQALEAEAALDGLWVTSVAEEDGGRVNRFRLRAVEVSRGAEFAGGASRALPTTGQVRVGEQAAAWVREGLTEEYSVSADGIRQDFVVSERPAGMRGAMAVELDLSGAQAAPAPYGAKLTVDGTGRELAYSRLKVTDASGRELQAELKVLDAHRIRVEVEDAGAAYPVRIDPTFSDADWVSMGTGTPGVNGNIYAMSSDGSTLYIGGVFDKVNGVEITNLAKWNGSAWSQVGTGMAGAVYALKVAAISSSYHVLVVGGDIVEAGGVSVSNVAGWDGTTWFPLGNGMAGSVGQLEYFKGYFYALSGYEVYQWDGGIDSDWVTQAGLTDGQVYTMAVSGSNMYFGGSFYNVLGVPMSNIAGFDGVYVWPLGLGVDNPVYGIAGSGNTIYAVGDFTQAGTVAAQNVAKWNGSSWSALGAGVEFSPTKVALIGSNLYVGGYGVFTAGGVTTNAIARWNGSSWSAMGNGLTSRYGDAASLVCMSAIGSTLYVAGSFEVAGDVFVDGLARWSGGTWSQVGPKPGLGVVTSFGGEVTALALSGNTLYAAGNFISAGGLAAHGIAKWNGSSWSPLGVEMDGEVYALAASGSTVYAGGSFTTVGGVGINYVMKWGGTGWSGLGLGTGGPVRALAVLGTTLYAGGDFATAGGVAASSIASWNGSEWSALGGDSLTGGASVLALVPGNGSLYVGGAFEISDGGAGFVAQNIAKWDGANWSGLMEIDPSTGIPSSALGPVRAIAVSGSDVYVGGDFGAAGPVSVAFLARWDGSHWNDVGGGTNNTVRALACAGGNLYVGGEFTEAGGLPISSLARWNGSQWSALGSGLESGYPLPAIAFVRSLVMNGTDLYVGGFFSIAGGKSSSLVARARVAFPEAQVTGVQLTQSTATITGAVNARGTSTAVVLEYGPDTNYGSSVPVTLSPNSSGSPVAVSKTISGLTSGVTYHFRLVATNSVGSSTSPDTTFFIPSGTIAFDLPPGSTIVVDESAGSVDIPIVRTGGSTGVVTATLNTANGTAVAPSDYAAQVNVPLMFGDTVTALTQQIPIYDPLNTDEVNEAFTVNLTGGFLTPGGATSVTVRILDSATDSKAPSTPVIITPAANSSVGAAAAGTVTVTGTATDNKGVGAVKVKLNGGSYVDAVLASPGAPSTNYTAQVPGSVAGTNTATAQSFDVQGNPSPLATRSFKVLRPLVVDFDNGLGSVTAGFAPSSFREVGKSYTITATPKSTVGIFTGWTIAGATNAEIQIADSARAKQTLTFIFREGLVLTANFVANPFLPLAGTYNGLIRASDSLPVSGGTVPANATEGDFTATVTTSGAFSGKLTIDGFVLNVAGAFDQNGDARFGSARLLTLVVARSGKPSLFVALHLNTAENAIDPAADDKITGTVTATGFKQSVVTDVSVVDSDRAFYNGTSLIVPASYLGAANATGTYTAVFPAKDVNDQTPGFTAADYPQGDGLGSITITKAGLVTITGTLADGTTVTRSTTLSEVGPTRPSRFPLFAKLYSAKGFLTGFVKLDSSQAASDFAAADLLWLRPTQTSSPHYLYGWPEGIKVDLLGAKYAVTAGVSVLRAPDGSDPGDDGDDLPPVSEDGNVMLTFSDGQLVETLIKAANLSASDAVTKAPDNDPTFSMKVNRTTGAVTGTFWHTDDTIPSYNAIIYQKGPQAGAYGYFLTVPPVPVDYSGEAGGVSILAQP